MHVQAGITYSVTKSINLLTSHKKLKPHPQARASLGEWLKEQSLFSHLLHGLFNVLNETSEPLKTQIEGT